MASQQPTPEEKLFAVIQGASQPPLRSKAKMLSLTRVGTTLSSLVGPVDLPRVNQALTMLIAAMGFWCLLSPALFSPRVNRLLMNATVGVMPHIGPPLAGLKSADEYLQQLVQQDPFRVGDTLRAAAMPEQVPEPMPPDAKALVADVKLVGISWGPEPVAMLEQHQQTYVLKRGETLGSLTVKEILPDRVILRAGTQDVELF